MWKATYSQEVAFPYIKNWYNFSCCTPTIGLALSKPSLAAHSQIYSLFLCGQSTVVFWVKWAEVDICKENDWFTHRCFVIQQWQLLLPTKYWPKKASERENWVSGLKTPRFYKHTLQPTLLFCPSTRNFPKTKYPTQQLFFFVKLHLKCSVKGQIYKFQEWEQILHASFLLCSGDCVLLTHENSKMLSSNRAQQETLPAAMELWIKWMQSTSQNCGCKTQTRNKALL